MAGAIQTKNDVINRVLGRLNAGFIQSLDEGTDGALLEAVQSAFEVTYLQALSLGDWAFSFKQSALPLLAKCPLIQYMRAFKLPPDFIKLDWVRSARDDQLSPLEVADYQIENGNIFCTDAEGPLVARYQYAAPVALWPNHFLMLMSELLAADLSLNFRADVAGAQIFHDRIFKRGGLLAQAILQERSQQAEKQRGSRGPDFSAARNSSW